MALNQSNMLQLDMYVYIEMQFILSHNAPSHIFNSSTVVECPALTLHH